MYKQNITVKADTLRWKRFSRQGWAVFKSLRREIVISTLAVGTLMAFTATPAQAQATSATHIDQADAPTEQIDEVEVTATRAPLPMQQAARVVSVITHEQIQNCPAQSVNDLLKLNSDVDLRQRGPFGIQTDISIDGGTHDQIVILLNGVNISSPHTGHLAADLPISIDDIERIEVLAGAASRVYGTNAFSGAINIVTRKPFREEKSNKAAFAINGGSFGTIGADVSLGITRPTLGNTLSAGYQQSDGGTPNSDFKKARAYYQGVAQYGQMQLDWQFGLSRMDYGANTFYSGRYPNQYEEGRRYTGSINMAIPIQNSTLAGQIYANRALDHYQLVKNTNVGENYHQTDVYGLNLNLRTVSTLGTTTFGADFRNEGILSTSLGRPLDPSQYVHVRHHQADYTRRDNRTNVTYFLEHNIIRPQWTLSAGLMANLNTALDHHYRFYPGIDLSYRPTGSITLYASWNMAQRMPTFTDLYYKSPTQEGNVGLKPERTSEFSLAAAFRIHGLRARLRAFHRHESSMIDWVMTPADAENGFTTYHATNFRLNKDGLQMRGEIIFDELFNSNSILRSLSADYTYINQKRHDNVEVVASSYALDYLRHKLALRLDAQPLPRLTLALTYRWQQRLGNYIRYTAQSDGMGGITYAANTESYRPYGLLDLRLGYRLSHVELYVEGNNLTSHRYYDIGNVLQPGFWLMSGAKYRF